MSGRKLDEEQQRKLVEGLAEFLDMLSKEPGKMEVDGVAHVINIGMLSIQFFNPVSPWQAKTKR